ncbi:MAG TPA: apolipoprotein N-acyltransferase [Caulobacteraceae bacterium]|jgi:apolipoprotein N-acyltransferase|nr:apolipoprotein N-acyltransferase [Caulobacteraceae bacterium]
MGNERSLETALPPFAGSRPFTIVLSLMAGAAVALAFPPFGLLPGLLGFALVMRLCGETDGRKPLRAAFWRGWLAGTAFFLIATWWVYQAFQVDVADQGWMAPFAVALLASGLGLFWGAAGLTYRWVAPTGWVRVLVFAGVMTAFEWLRGHLLTGFPWDLPGEAWPAGSPVSQAAALMGAYGLSWITVAIASAPALLLDARGLRKAIAACICAGVVLAGLYGYGAARLARTLTPAADAPVVRIVQPGLPEVANYTAATYADTVRAHLALTSQPAARRPDIIVWPERAIPGAFSDYLAPGTWTRDAITAALTPGQILLTGGYRTQAAPQGAYAPDGLTYFNSLLALRRDATGLDPIAVYDKYRLVPFGEYLPLARWLAPLHVQELVHVGDGFSPGPPPRPMAIDGAPLAQPLICYEALYPGFARKGAIRAGRRAAWIVNVSDDAWFGGTYGPIQHLNLASYRAIEEGLPIVRATPTGVSAVIDAYGRVAPGMRLGQGQVGVIDAPLPPALAPTLYDRLGTTILVLMMLLSATATGLTRFQRAQSAKK